MSIDSPIIQATIKNYLASVTRENAVAKRLRDETSKLPMAQMITSPDQVAFLAVMIRLAKAQRVIEIGTFTGYGTLAMAQALPKDGKIIACDISTEYTDIARRYWAEAGVADQIDLRIAPAEKTLSALLDAGHANSFDFIFIDADKGKYDLYYEASLKLLKSRGLIALDNMLWGGAVADEKEQDGQTKTLRALNLKLRDDTRIESCLLTVADGIALAIKR